MWIRCVHRIRYTVHCTLYTVYCTLYTVHRTLYTVHCTLYTVYCTLYSINFTLKIVHVYCRNYTENCALCNVCTGSGSILYTLHRASLQTKMCIVHALTHKFISIDVIESSCRNSSFSTDSINYF